MVRVLGKRWKLRAWRILDSVLPIEKFCTQDTSCWVWSRSYKFSSSNTLCSLGIATSGSGLEGRLSQLRLVFGAPLQLGLFLPIYTRIWNWVSFFWVWCHWHLRLTWLLSYKSICCAEQLDAYMINPPPLVFLWFLRPPKTWVYCEYSENIISWL